MNRRDWYERVNAAWPAGPLPALTAAEAVKAAKRLFRFCKVKEKIAATSGNRHNWYLRGTFYVNPDKGWRTLVHSISHWAYYRRHQTTGEQPHNKNHARLELRLIKQVLKRGWLDGRLKPQPRPTMVADVLTGALAGTPIVRPATEAEALSSSAARKLDHALAMLKRADTRLKRAETIRRKWARRVRRLQKVAAPLAVVG